MKWYRFSFTSIVAMSSNKYRFMNVIHSRLSMMNPIMCWFEHMTILSVYELKGQRLEELWLAKGAVLATNKSINIGLHIKSEERTC